MRRKGHLLERLQSLGPPEPHLPGPFGRRPTADGWFEVYGHPIRLRPPIDWRQDPHASRSWCYQLHSLIWLKPLFLAYAESGDQTAFAVALDIVIDWISAHSDEAAEVSEFAWYDMAVSQRAPAMAYALRAGIAEDILDEERANLLLLACSRHGVELSDESKYSADHNHGLAQDEALYLLAHQIPVLPAARAWSEIAIDRLHRTMEATISKREGDHLEHSTEYQFAITRMVARLAETMSLPELPELHKRLRKHAAWHVMPNGRNAQIGDTDDHLAEGWATEAAAGQSGMAAFFETGSAFVREGDSYLAVTAAHHSSAHKHSDGTGFLLVESGQVLLGDAGRWSYYESEPDRIYARSAFAHNVLTVDEQDFGWRQSEPYKSGLLAAGEANGWYAVLATNPLLGLQGVEHRRLLLYRPGKLLVVIDDVRAEEPHDYARRFHLGPALEARLDEEGRVAVEGEGVKAALADLDGDTEVTLTSGQDEPTRLGWTYPGDRKRLPVWTATMRSRAANATMTAVLGLGNASPVVTQASLEADHAVVTMDKGTIQMRFDLDSGQAELHTCPTGPPDSTQS
jgi:Heparinase II/III-like protein/Heparinase II/III N-terminus